jgi:hypothetical protein
VASLLEKNAAMPDSSLSLRRYLPAQGRRDTGHCHRQSPSQAGLLAGQVGVKRDPLFAKTTAAQVPVDGGNERVI